MALFLDIATVRPDAASDKHNNCMASVAEEERKEKDSKIKKERRYKAIHHRI